MTQFIDFMQENWKLILTLCLGLVEIIFIFVKRRPKSIDDFKFALYEALTLVPELVDAVERPGEGEAKKSEVEHRLVKLVERRLGRGLSSGELLLLTSEVDNKIEAVLAAPTKKEKFNEK